MENISEKSKKIVGARQLPRITVVIALAAMMQFAGVAANAADRLIFTNSIDVTDDQIILVELKESAADSNLFDLENTTISFVPNDEGGYSVERKELQWNPDIGEEMEASFLDSTSIIANRYTLENFEFPFSGDNLRELYVSPSGLITFSSDIYSGIMQRIDAREFRYESGLKDLSGSFFENTIAPLFWIYSPRNISGNIHVNEDSDSVTLTFSVSEPCCNLDAYTTSNNINDYQVKLDSSGQIDISYKKIESKAGVVGVFPVHEYGHGQLIDSFDFEESNHLSPQYDITNLSIYKSRDNRNVEFVYTFAGDLSAVLTSEFTNWFFSILYRGERKDAGFRSILSLGSTLIRGAQPKLKVYNDSEIVSEPIIHGNKLFLNLNFIHAQVGDVIQFESRIFENSGKPGDEIQIEFTYPDLINRESIFRNVDFSTEEINDLQSRIYEGFFYQNDRNTEITTHRIMCDVIRKFGDTFTLAAHYSSFRTDRGAASSPIVSYDSSSKGIGIGSWFRADPRDGPTLVGSCRSYDLQSNLDKIIPLGSVPGSSFGSAPYLYSSGLLVHEIGHNWVVSPALRAKIGEERVYLSQFFGGHWRNNLHNPVAVSISGRDESSTMGGTNWRDNGDGTFSRIRSQVLTSGFSYMDLYLMGLIPPENVPDFYMVNNYEFVEIDSDGNWLYTVDKVDVAIEDVIAANGPRFPTYLESPKDFNMAFTYVRQYGEPIDQGKLDMLRGVRDAFFDRWCAVTGGLSTMYSQATSKYESSNPCILLTDLGNGTEDPTYGVPYDWPDLDISDFATIEYGGLQISDQDLNEGDTFSAFVELEGTGIVDIYVGFQLPDYSRVNLGSDGSLNENSEALPFLKSHVLESGVRQRIELITVTLEAGSNYDALQKGDYFISIDVAYEGQKNPLLGHQNAYSRSKKFKVN